MYKEMAIYVEFNKGKDKVCIIEVFFCYSWLHFFFRIDLLDMLSF